MENQNRKKVTQTVYERLAQVYSGEKAYYLTRALDDIQLGKIKEELKSEFFNTILFDGIPINEENYIKWLKAFNNTDMVE